MAREGVTMVKPISDLQLYTFMVGMLVAGASVTILIKIQDHEKIEVDGSTLQWHHPYF